MAGAVAESPVLPASAHLWVDGLLKGELITVTVVNHTQLNYVGGQGRYDFPIAGQAGDLIRIMAGAKEVGSFTYEPGAQVYISLIYSDGTIAASTYHPGDAMPAPFVSPSIRPAPATEHTGIGSGSSWIVAPGAMMAIVAVGCVATVWRKKE